MDIEVLGSSGGEAPGMHLTAFAIGDDMLLDAGSVGLKLDLERQRRIRHILLTHAHLDHIHALPFLLDNVIGRIDGTVRVYGAPATLAAVHEHLFNGALWPDFTRLPTPEKSILTLCPVEPGRPFAAGAYQVTAAPTLHSVPSQGYVITGPEGAVVFTGDTAPSQALWQEAARASRLLAVFMECSYPRRLQELAARTRHLTTADIPTELAKLGRPADMPVYIYHLKPEFASEIVPEAAALPGLTVRAVREGDVIHLP